MVKTKKNNHDISYDQQIKHLFILDTKNMKQEIGDEKKPETLDELNVENYSHILYPIEFAIASH